MSEPGPRSVRAADRRKGPCGFALFVTCLADTLFPNAGQAMVTLLERLGTRWPFPMDQTCCGQMHLNSGTGPRRFHR